MASHLAGDLEQLRALPLEAKIGLTKARIRQWLDHYDGMAYVSFSGGKDSTVLAHLVHQVDPTVPLVFSNTGLEYASIQSFARKIGAEIIRPEMRFDEVITKYGYPIISKEVSEAIYYARRIRNGSERERTPERKRTELQGSREREREGSTESGMLYRDTSQWTSRRTNCERESSIPGNQVEEDRVLWKAETIWNKGRNIQYPFPLALMRTMLTASVLKKSA